ncbi:nucleotidyltransferase family protein [Roseobacter sp.]|uniref:nucleotidyltransferase family protein n=1 Tax=Roseobacter sp. TaxID=1907202 RepID=UPI0025FCFD70|nr:nucleotidyltransferase family protein [Roseobacter sp.]
MPGAVMLFAAGFGTRMRPLTDDRPKPMITVAGRPLIDHALALIRETSPDRIVVNLHYKPGPLITHLKGTDVVTVTEDPDILDTGGGLRNALPHLGTAPVLTMNPDAVWTGPNPLQALYDAWDGDRMDALLMCVPLAQTIGRSAPGDFSIGAGGHLNRGGDLVYGGVQIISTALLHDIPDPVFSLNRVWDLMHARGRLFGLVHSGRWCDVGHPDGIAAAEAMLEADDG